METRDFDIIVIGAGIVGLATAMELLKRRPGLRLLVLEKEPQVGSHQSSHNSGVIHSGLYYRPGSLKARLCVEGAAAMATFCQEHGISYSQCGKVVLACDSREVASLMELYRRGQANRVPKLRLIGPDEIREIEPHAQGIYGIHVPTCGITDFHKVTQKYAELVTQLGGDVKTGTAVTGILRRGGTVVETTSGAFGAKFVVNCAGLQGDLVGQMEGSHPKLKIVPFRGEYYSLTSRGSSLVRGLIYPVPDPRFPFLGVHFTTRVNGEVEAGPNAVLALKREGYKRTSFSVRDAFELAIYPGTWRLARRYWRTGTSEYYRSLWKPAFVRALQRLVPEVRNEDLQAGGAGVRAMVLRRDGTIAEDFEFEVSERAIHVYNVPSPAATASLMIGRYIANAIEKAAGMSCATLTNKEACSSTSAK